jgi:hypothetical protein
MNHAERAEAELAAVAARAVELRAGARRCRARGLAALAVILKADDVFHQWPSNTQFDSFDAAPFASAYILSKPLKNDGV